MPPPRRINRLDSLNKPGLARPRSSQRPAPQKNTAKTCCPNPKIEDQEGSKVCMNCFTEISENNIVSDVTFEEDSRGAATVQGGYIAEGARHARTMGAAAYRRVGGGERNSMQDIEQNGRRELNALVPRVGVPQTTSDQALSIWTLAAKQNFTAGRTTSEVIGACLFAACKRQKGSNVMVMDISDALKIGVFRLGEVYKDLCRELFIEGESHIGIQHLVEVEPLILKYCRKLEFGNQTKQVAEDAIRIVHRMKRDWITTGRHPAGLCGACIILAARMNNFRRSVREVVYVAKVADVTVAKRVEEFRRTKSAGLTVDQFRVYGNRLKHQHDPPAIAEAALRQQKLEAKKRKRQAHNEEREGSVDGSSRASSVVDQTPEPETNDEDERRKRARTSAPDGTSQQTARFDSDGFAIPNLPASATANNGELSPAKKRRGRPKKSERPEPVQLSEEELADERELEEEIEGALENPEVQETQRILEQGKAEERAKLLSEEQKKIAAARTEERRDTLGINWWKDKQPMPEGIITAEDLEAEFADDPEVNNCMLSSEEAQAKEKIWVAYNEDWLRTQHEKELLKAIAAANGNSPSKKSKGGRKKRSKMGDGTLLAETGTPIETPADANAAMLAKRAPVAFSRYVNYEALNRVYGASPAASGSRAGSEAPSERAGSVALGASDRGSPTPTPGPAAAAVRSPPATQRPRHDEPEPEPQPTAQPQAEAGAEDEEVASDEDDYNEDVPNEDENEYRYDDEYDEREDIGEDDFNRVVETAAVDEAWGEYE